MSAYGWIAKEAYGYVEKGFSDWLYGGYDEDKYNMFTALYSVPGLNSYMDYLLDKRAVNEYFNRYGMTYADIHDPRKLRTTSSSGRVLNFVSSNIKRLY